MNIIQNKNWGILIKEGKNKLLLFRGNVEQIRPNYGPDS